MPGDLHLKFPRCHEEWTLRGGLQIYGERLWGTGVQAFFDVQAYNKPTNLLDDLQAKLSNDSVIDGESVDGLGNVQGVTLALGYEAGEGCVHASG